MSNSIETFFYNLSLKNKEEAWKNIIVNSFPIVFIAKIIAMIEKYIKPLAKESIAANLSESITLFSIMLLIFASPFVSTDMNALLVIFTVLSTSLKHFLKPETISRKTDVLTFTVLAYFAIAIVAAGFSPYFVTALHGYSKMIIYFLAYFVFIVNINSLKNIRLLIWTMVIAASIVSAYGVYQFYIKVEPYQGALWDDPNATSYKTTRVYSFLKNPNLLAGYLLPTTAFTAAFYFMNLGWRRLVLVISLYLQLSCLFYTYSRGGWIGAAGMAGIIVLAAVFIFWKRIINSKIIKWGLISIIVLGFLGAIIVLLKSPAVVERISTIFTIRGHSSNSFRMNVWISSFNMFKDNFIIGIGPGNNVFNKIYPLYMFSGFKALSAYNIFLETAIETGIIGLFVFVYMLFTHSCRCIWGIVSNINYSSRILLTACITALTGLVLQGMVDTVWYRPQVHILLWFIISLITIVSRDEFALKETSNE